MVEDGCGAAVTQTKHSVQTTLSDRTVIDRRHDLTPNNNPHNLSAAIHHHSHAKSWFQTTPAHLDRLSVEGHLGGGVAEEKSVACGFVGDSELEVEEGVSLVWEGLERGVEG